LKPLSGLHILVTRPRDRASKLAAPLRKLGARVTVHSAIEIRPPRSWSAVDREIGRLEDFDAVVFTSATAVDAFLRRSRGRSLPPAGAVGPATAEALRKRGVRPAWIARRFTAADLGKRLRGRVLHPASQPRSPDLAREARKRGAVVVEPVVYRIVRARGAGRPPAADLVTFASAETVRGYADAAGAPAGTACACIGPVTARAARAAGFKVVAQPRRYTIPDLVSAIVKWNRTRS
jgi:uroporphyrinogen III methyltransferase/synthase